MRKTFYTVAVAALAVGVSFQTSAAQQKTNINLQPTGNVAVSTKNLQTGEAFLAKNKNKKGVVSLPSGLQYKILKKGTGPKPSTTSVVTVNYEGKLINGTVFDSSYRRGQPTTFPLNNVIPGWQQALQLMKVGSTWKIFVPPQLAYGSRGAGSAIGPNETLIFKVNLIKIDS